MHTIVQPTAPPRTPTTHLQFGACVNTTRSPVTFSVGLVLGGDPAARSSLHSEACNALGAFDGVIHSSISLEVVSLRANTVADSCLI